MGLYEVPLSVSLFACLSDSVCELFGVSSITASHNIV